MDRFKELAVLHIHVLKAIQFQPSEAVSKQLEFFELFSALWLKLER